ncbi:alpha/beta hydrolase [Aestuariivita boseongensis]|uniref:alpha/beta hydrolase n=1 Tax=Aestuariivita boseongensis TaxID=1470562 RepID=UPI000680BBAD|nr:alpha/beta hydrolase [Aestuariivita boseongensis]
MSSDLYLHYRNDGAANAPVVFAFHGTGGDEHQFTGLLSDILPQATLIAPRGDVSEMGAARFFRRTGEGVYDMNDLAQRTEKMGNFIAAMRQGLEDRPMIGLGYSNGANILAAVLFDRPDLFDRAVLMHPLIPFDPAPQPGLADKDILITAGARDPICPLPLSDRLAAWFEGQGSTVSRHTHPGGHEVQQSELAEIAAFLTA